MIKVSIIIPYLNGEKSIKRCIESIINQQYKDYEIILVDDGSTDNSKEIVKQYNDKVKYYYIEKESIGVGKARNYGISMSKGKYIMFVDVDDYIDKNLLKEMDKYINQEIEIIKFKMKLLTNEGQEIIADGPIFEKIKGEEGFNRLCFYDKYLDSPCLYIIKKELIERTNLKFPENTYHEDFGLIPQLIARSESIISTSYVGYYYVQTSESIIRNKDYNKTLKKIEDKFCIYQNMLKNLDNLNKKTKYNMKTYYINSIIISLRDLNKQDRKRYEKKIKKMKMIKNIKVTTLKQLIKKVILKVNIEIYLNIKERE